MHGSDTAKSAQPVYAPGEFTHYIRERLLQRDDITLLSQNDMELVLQIDDNPVRVSLEPLYDAYRQSSQTPDDAVAYLTRLIDSFSPAQLVTDFQQLRTTIFPMLKPIALLAAVRERHLPMLIYRPLLDELIISYVIDQQGSVSYINEQHLTEWKISPDVLHAQAITNLRERTEQTGFTTLGEGSQRLFLSSSQDGYDATRLLLTEVLAGWQNLLPGRLVVSVPNRDLLLGFSDADPLTLQQLVRQIQIDRLDHPAGLTDQLYTLIDGSLTYYTQE